MKKYFKVGFIISMALVLATPVLADNDIISHGPRIKYKNGNGASTNWAGYAVQTDMTTPQSNAVTDVKGTWIVPGVICDKKNTYSSAWVGIDGYSDGSVEQIGTEQDCSHGKASYYAWYEMYPNPAYKIQLAVKAGDTIQGEVSYVNNQFVLTLTNVSNHGTSVTIKQTTNAQRQSAEWVIEAPWLGKVLPLANFGTINFSSASATVNNVTGGINNSAWQNDSINMVNNSGGLKATTSSLSSDGSAFNVIWNSSN